MLTISNDGPCLVATNYWSSDYARRGAAYISVNAGAFRLLLPPSLEEAIADMATATMVIISRGPWPEQRRPDAIELLFDDGSRSPFALHVGTEQIDRLPRDEDAQGAWICSVWVRSDDGPHEVLSRPARYRRVARLPDLTPYKES